MQVNPDYGQREKNFELLRVVCMLAVIIIHISGSYIESVTNMEWFHDYYLRNIGFTCFMSAQARFAVQSFIMLSGAFTLSDERNADFRYYYRKIFKKILIPTLFFSAVYFIYLMLKSVLGIMDGELGLWALMVPIKAWIVGMPFYHMWYLYTMLEVYLMVPVVVRLKKELGEKKFARMTVIFFPLAMFSLWTSWHRVYWDLGYCFCYLGYFMMGNVIRERFHSRKSGSMAALTIGMGTCVLCLLAFFRFRQAMAGIADEDLKYQLVQPFCPLPVLASLLIFTGFTRLDVKLDCSKLSRISFEVYLIHPFIWDNLRRFIPFWADSRIVIPLSLLIVLSITVIVAIVYRKAAKAIDEKWNIIDRLCKVFPAVIVDKTL